MITLDSHKFSSSSHSPLMNHTQNEMMIAKQTEKKSVENY